MANHGILIKFDTSHHALVLEATLVLLIAQMILSKLRQYGVKTLLPRSGGRTMAQISTSKGAAHDLQPFNSNDRTHIRAGRTHKIDALSFFSISNPWKCLEENIVPHTPP